MSALSTTEQTLIATRRTHRWLNYLRPGERDWLRAQRWVNGRFERWTDAQQAALLQDVLTASGDAETYIAEACVFDAEEAAGVLSHIACGNDQALGKLMREKIAREYHELLVDVVDLA